jgi:hypothetical protein
MLAISIDNLASRYHLLPSEAMIRATTFDLYILDVGARWNRRQHDRATGREPDVPDLSEQDMFAALNLVKEQK